MVGNEPTEWWTDAKATRNSDYDSNYDFDNGNLN